MDLLINKSLTEFNGALSSGEPAPGGGSAAAVASLLGSALALMVAHLSIGKKSFDALDNEKKEKFESDYLSIKERNDALIKLVDADTAAFNKVMAALKLPKETQAQRALRAEALERANTEALKIPLEVAEKSLEILRHQMNIARYGNKNAASDIGVGAILAFAGLEGALLNVRINLPGITDEALVIGARQRADSCAKEGAALKYEILDIVNARIG